MTQNDVRKLIMKYGAYKCKDGRKDVRAVKCTACKLPTH